MRFGERGARRGGAARCRCSRPPGAAPLPLKEARDRAPTSSARRSRPSARKRRSSGCRRRRRRWSRSSRAPRPSTRKAAIDALGRLAETKPGAGDDLLSGGFVHDGVPRRARRCGGIARRRARARRQGNRGAEGQRGAIPTWRRGDARPRERSGRAGKVLGAQAARALAEFAGDVDPSGALQAAAAMGALGAPVRRPAARWRSSSATRIRRCVRRRGGRRATSGRVRPILDRVLLASFAGGS